MSQEEGTQLMVKWQSMQQSMRQTRRCVSGVLLVMMICGGLSEVAAQGACALPGGNPNCQSDSASLPGVNGATGAGNPVGRLERATEAPSIEKVWTFVTILYTLPALSRSK